MSFASVNFRGALVTFKKSTNAAPVQVSSTPGVTTSGGSALVDLDRDLKACLGIAKSNVDFFEKSTAKFHVSAKTAMTALVDLGKKAGKNPTDAQLAQAKKLVASIEDAMAEIEQLKVSLLKNSQYFYTPFKEDCKKMVVAEVGVHQAGFLTAFEKAFDKFHPDNCLKNVHVVSVESYVSRAEQITTILERAAKAAKSDSDKKTLKKTGNQAGLDALNTRLSDKAKAELAQINAQYLNLGRDMDAVRNNKINKNRSAVDKGVKAKSTTQADLNDMVDSLNAAAEGHKMLRSYAKACKAILDSYEKLIKSAGDVIKADEDMSKDAKMLGKNLGGLVDFLADESARNIKWESDVAAKFKKLAAASKLKMPEVKIKK